VSRVVRRGVDPQRYAHLHFPYIPPTRDLHSRHIEPIEHAEGQLRAFPGFQPEGSCEQARLTWSAFPGKRRWLYSPKRPIVKPPKADEDLMEAAEKVAARRGREEADAFLRFWQHRREVCEDYPLTDEEAMELAVSELHAMRAERDQKVKASR
jgi:hypothetical protein